MSSAFFSFILNYEFFVNKRKIRDKSHLRDRLYDRIDLSKEIICKHIYVYLGETS